MSPLHIRIILHIHCFPELMPELVGDRQFWAPACKEAIDYLLRCEMIHYRSDSARGQNQFATTDRGAAYVDGLTRMELPIKKTVWVIE